MDKIDRVFQILKYSIIFGIIYMLYTIFAPMTISLSNLLDRLAPPAEANVMTSQTIISSLRGIGRLVTVTSEPHTANITVGVKKGFWIFENLTGYSADHDVESIIEAGIDFTKIRTDSLRCEQTCTLIVPHPTITNCAITRLWQSNQSFALGRRKWELLEELGRSQAIQHFIKEVDEQEDIIAKAKENTEIVLGEFVSGLLGKPVHIEFEEEPEELVTGPTCQPDPPLGWKQIDGDVWAQQDE